MPPKSYTWPTEGPELPVWTYLESGLDWARTQEYGLQVEVDQGELPKRKLGAAEQRLVTEYADAAFQVITGLVVSKKKRDALIREDFAAVDEERAEPWADFAIDLRFAELAVARGCHALERYVQLKPIVSELRLDPRSTGFLREAVQTFIFGFDAACIAFCAATIESILKEFAPELELASSAEVKRAGLTGGSLLHRAAQKKKLPMSRPAAQRTIDLRNRVLHRDVRTDGSLESEGLEAIAALKGVLKEVANTRRQRPH